MKILSKRKRIKKKQLKNLKNKGIIVGKSFKFLFENENNDFDKEFKDYI